MHDSLPIKSQPHTFERRERAVLRKTAKRQVAAIEQSETLTKPEKGSGARWPNILDKISAATGTKHAMVGDCIVGQVGECFVESPSADAADRVLRAVVSMEEMAPSNLTESMLAGQMLTANTAAQRFLALALVEGQTVEDRDRNVDRATRLMRVFMEQVDVMQRGKAKFS